MGIPITSSQFPRLLDKRMREVFSEKFNELPTMIPTLFRMMDSQGAFEEFYEVGAMPDISEFNGKLEYISPSPGYYVKIEPKEYAGGTMIEKKLIDDKKYSVLDNLAGMLGGSAARVREKLAVRQFANAFSAAFDYQTSEEGVALCGTHTTKSGVSTSSGFSNAGTSALSPTSIAATRILMRKFKNDIGERIEINPTALIVPDALADKAMEIMGTEKGLYSAEGTKNVQAGRFKVIPYMRLDDSDTNDWFMVDEGMMKKYLVFIDRIKAQDNSQLDFETFHSKFSTYFRCAAGFLEWRWIYGQKVT
jgi:phage major head subunit gpT-like protein